MFSLLVANASSLDTYNEKLISLDFGLRHTFNWPFIIAAVNRSIYRGRLSSFFGLLVNVIKPRLVD